MSAVAAIGAETLIGGFALAGALVYPSATADQVRAAWRDLPRSVAVVLLTATAADTLSAERRAPDAPLTAVIP
jgi:vacuolar-type H+-ATPase subunit F/Vma7